MPAEGFRTPDGQVEVRVPADERDRAFDLIAAHMEDLVAAARADAATTPTAGNGQGAHAHTGWDDGGAADPEDGHGRPLVSERLRALGFLPILLIPLMVVVLGASRLPRSWILILFVGAAVAVVALRDRA